MPGSFQSSDRLAQRLGAILALFGVILGAMAAHGRVHDCLAARQGLDLWHTALFQQWVHALALLALSHQTTARRGPVICWVTGVVLFSGSLYVLGLDPGLKWMGPITPLGGLFLIAGWVLLWISLLPGRGNDGPGDAI